VMTDFVDSVDLWLKQRAKRNTDSRKPK
jgi:hypothetical protein